MSPRPINEIANGRAWMASEVRYLAHSIECMQLLDWWLLQDLLEDSVRVLSQAIQLRPMPDDVTPTTSDPADPAAHCQALVELHQLEPCPPPTYPSELPLTRRAAAPPTECHSP